MRKDEAWPEDSPEYKAGNEIEKLGLGDVSHRGIVPAATSCLTAGFILEKLVFRLLHVGYSYKSIWV